MLCHGIINSRASSMEDFPLCREKNGMEAEHALFPRTPLEYVRNSL